MKSDLQLKNDVTAELAWDPSINATAIGVAVKDGIVTVSGHLQTYAEKIAVQKALRRVAGVKAIAIELDVLLSATHRRSDTELAAAAEGVLRGHASIPADRIRLLVDKGWITLQGEVEWDYQRRAVEKALRPLIGVVGITDEIELKPQVSSKDVQRGIREALARQSEREARHIEVSASGSTITLRGTVHSWQERDAACGAAWSSPGVSRVINEVRVG